MIFKTKKIAILISVIVGLILVLKFTGIFNWYTMSNSVMEPNIKTNSILFTSNIYEINHNDVVVFNNDSINEHWSFRLIGKPGDTILIENGVLFRNSIQADRNYKTLEKYIIGKNLFQKIKNKTNVFHSYQPYQIQLSDTLLIETDKNFADSLGLKQFIYPKTYIDELIKEKYNRNWNIDNFGPIVIPTKHYFLMGDNRDNAFDSRYIGFISEDNIISKVIN